MRVISGISSALTLALVGAYHLKPEWFKKQRTPQVVTSSASQKRIEMRQVAEKKDDYRELPVVYGDPKAPVTLVELSSFSCPACRHFHKNVLPSLKKKFIDTGKVKLIVVDYPLDEAALKIATMAWVGDLERYKKLREHIFKTYDKWIMEDDYMKALYEQMFYVGMDAKACEEACDDLATQNGVIAKWYAYKAKYEFEGTPTFLVTSPDKGEVAMDELEETLEELTKS